MAQAAMDASVLDAPSDSAKSGPILNDDLLSKLAGEEIDRLLAEADSHAAQNAVEPPEPKPVETIDDPVAETVVSSAETDLAKELDMILGGPKEEPAEAPAPLPPPAAPAPVPAAEETAHVAKLAEELEVDKPTAAAVVEELTVKQTAPARPPRTSFLLYPLIWINMPIEFLPDPMRRLMGKAAVLTLINAVGILVYVAAFRKHP
jgi:hypothetical protein